MLVCRRFVKIQCNPNRNNISIAAYNREYASAVCVASSAWRPLTASALMPAVSNLSESHCGGPLAPVGDICEPEQDHDQGTSVPSLIPAWSWSPASPSTDAASCQSWSAARFLLRAAGGIHLLVKSMSTHFLGELLLVPPTCEPPCQSLNQATQKPGPYRAARTAARTACAMPQAVRTASQREAAKCSR